jgi:hypothetical protein
MLPTANPVLCFSFYFSPCSYSFYRDESLETFDIGTLEAPAVPVPASSDPTYLDSTSTKSGLQECLNRCDDKVDCL